MLPSSPIYNSSMAFIMLFCHYSLETSKEQEHLFLFTALCTIVSTQHVLNTSTFLEWMNEFINNPENEASLLYSVCFSLLLN